MTIEEEPLLPPTIQAAMAERQLLKEQLLTVSREQTLRIQGLAARVKELTRTFAPDQPHPNDTKEEFLRLHKSYIDSINDLRESNLRSSALMKEIPSSKSSWQFIKNRSTPTKALHHELRVVSALRSEFAVGIKERAVIVDGIEDVVGKMQVLVDAETSA